MRSMRMKLLVALIFSLLIVTTLAHAQEATVEAPAGEATLEVELIAPIEVQVATQEAHSEGTEEAGAEGEQTAVEEEASEGEEAPAGSALLMLLLGIGVVVAVGGLTMLRGGSKPPQA